MERGKRGNGIGPSLWGGVKARALVSTLVLLLAGMMGCEEGFDPASKLNTLRVLAVQADNPYPKPGQDVQLRMLWHDGKAPVDEPRQVQVVWLGGCFNPNGDLYVECFPQLAEKLSQGQQNPSEMEGIIGFGDTFSLQVPADLISSRPKVENGQAYGLTYVFFAACAGQLGPVEPGEDGLPIGCFDSSGGLLGAEDFVPGYLGLYSFEDRTNSNPQIDGLEIDGVLWDPAQEAVFPACRKGSCRDLKLRVVVARDSVESNTGYVDSDGKHLSEQMWVEYAATGGQIDRSPRLVNDASKGFNEDNGTAYTPPGQPGKHYVFAIVRDNRGGVAWVRQALRFE